MSRALINASALVVFLSVMAPVNAGALSPEVRFAQAAQAYDAEQYGKAIGFYEQLLTDGFRTPELHFNLGNAHFRIGDYGSAILHYKHAEHLAPRDADIRENLHFALMQTDAAHAPPSPPGRWLRLLNLSEWVVIASVTWWLTAIYLCLALRPGGRRGWGFTASLSVCLLFISLAGIHQWLSLHFKPEVVVTKPGQEALFAPIEQSTAHFTLPPGSIARIDSSIEGWYRVRVGDKDGWIRHSAATPITPWKTDPEVDIRRE